MTTTYKALEEETWSKLWKKKIGLDFVNKTDLKIMLPEFYRTNLLSQLSQSQLLTLGIFLAQTQVSEVQ